MHPPNPPLTQLAVIRSSYSPFGGAEVLTLDLIKALLKKNIAITLLTWPRQAWPLADPNLRLVELGSAGGHRLLRLFAFEHAVKKFLHSHPFAHVLSMDLVSSCTHYHGGGGSHRSYLENKNRGANPITKLLQDLSPFHRYTNYLQRQCLTNPNLKKIHCCSHLVANDFRRQFTLPPEKIALVPNSIDWHGIGAVFAERETVGKSLRAEHGLQLPPAARPLLFLGSGFPRKGLDLAIRGLATLPSDYHLLVVGKGEAPPYLRLGRELGVADRLHFLGPQKEGWRFAALCHALLLPARYEPFGLVAAEVQAMGLPVLVSANTGFAEWVRDGETGIVLRGESEEEIAEKFSQLHRLLRNPKFSAQNLRDMVRELDNSVVIEQLLTDFLQLPR